MAMQDLRLPVSMKSGLFRASFAPASRPRGAVPSGHLLAHRECPACGRRGEYRRINRMAEDDGLDCLDLLEETPAILGGLMRELSHDDAHWKPAPDRFSVRSTLRHADLAAQRTEGDPAYNKCRFRYRDCPCVVWVSTGRTDLCRNGRSGLRNTQQRWCGTRSGAQPEPD